MLNEKSIIKVIFNKDNFIEYEVPDEGVMFYSEKEGKTYFLNYVAIEILKFGDGKSIGDVVSCIKKEYDIIDVTEKALLDDIYELCNNLLDNNIIEIDKGLD